MNNQQKTEIWNWFTTFVNGFKSDDPEIQINYDLKHEHSLRVVDNMRLLAKSLQLPEDQYFTAETIALLHDVGRFEQFRDYQTYLDIKSVNHAELGLEILDRYKVLSNLNIDDQECIVKSIRYHNRAEIPKDETEVILLFARLIRDADKLDIWKVVIDYYTNPEAQENPAMGFNLPDGPEISDIVVQSIINREHINYKHLKYLNDMKLAMAGWVFDLNFDASVRLLDQRGYISVIRKLLPDNENVSTIFSNINDYIEEKSNNVTIS